MKSYTDIEQSKKLEEILPLESADMHYWRKGQILGVGHSKEMQEGFKSKGIDYSPCWSFAALLSVLPEKYTELIKEGGMYRIIIKDSYMTSLFYNPVDACVAMIEKLHELKML